MNFAKICKNTFFTERVWATASLMCISLHLLWFHEIHIKRVNRKSPRTIKRKNEFKRESSVEFVTDWVHIFEKNWKAKNGNKRSLWLKDTPKAFDYFKNKQKSVWTNVFWYVEVYIFSKCIEYTIHWNKTQMLKEIPPD